MSDKADPTGFGKFVPGFEFLQKLAQGGSASMGGWVAPTLDAQALDKRIEELKAVQFWLDQNAAALKATIQALEVQKMTLATLKSMNMPMPGAPGMGWPVPPQAAPAASQSASARKPRAAAAGAATAPPAGTPLPDPLQFWGALTRQFQQIASEALQDVATRSEQAPASAAVQAGAAAKPPARPATPRARRKT